MFIIFILTMDFGLGTDQVFGNTFTAPQPFTTQHSTYKPDNNEHSCFTGGGNVSSFGNFGGLSGFGGGNGGAFDLSDNMLIFILIIGFIYITIVNYNNTKIIHENVKLLMSMMVAQGKIA
jgi:hypothetical protein